MQSTKDMTSIMTLKQEHLLLHIFFKKLAEEGKTKYVEVDGSRDIETIKQELLSKIEG